MKKFFSKLLIILICALFLEVIVFNITSYRTFWGKYEKKYYDEGEFLYYGEDENKAFIKFDNINKKVATIKLNFTHVGEVSEYKVFYSDATSDEYSELNSKEYIRNYEKSKYMPLYLSGEVKGFIISIDKQIYDSEKFEGITINEKIPFDFNVIRFICTFIVILFIVSLKKTEFFNKEYSMENLRQEAILLLILSVFFVSTAFINNYSAINESEIYNKYYVEALLDGKFYLNQEPSENFLKLEDPYDYITRGEKTQRDVDYLWDTAYFNGHQYIYFGILPLLLTFLPYYVITKKVLSIKVVVFVFSILIFVLLKEILVKILNKFFKKISFKFVIYFLITLCSGSLILYANGMARVYELVIVSGLYFVFQGLYFIIKASENENKRYLFIFLGSLCLALSVACRPTDLLASILILPFLINLLIKNIKNFKNTKTPLIKLIFAVAIPYITVGILIMWFNYVRFGNVFEFGAKYQMTINNMKELGSRIWAIPTGIIANLFSIPIFKAEFPFLNNHNELITFYGYYYIENMIGGIFMLVPICFMNFYVIKLNRKTENKALKILINSLIVVALVIAIISIMMAGSNQRYLIDYAWMFILAGILIFMGIYNLLKTDEAKRILEKILAVITIYTFLVGILSGIVSEKSYMKSNSPEKYYEMRYMVCFWE